MENNVLKYKGYYTKPEYDVNSRIIYGKIEGISDLVNFECENLLDVEKEFQSAVDDYLEFCKSVGKEPEKEYTGRFNVRVKPELHKKLVYLASQNDTSLNNTVEKAIEYYIESSSK